jgi:tyrosine decarboxylase / aspartate 1-decarboxylase
LHLALVQLPQPWFEPTSGIGVRDGLPLVTSLRSVLMKPEHEEWLNRIWQEYQAASHEELGTQG